MKRISISQLKFVSEYLHISIQKVQKDDHKIEFLNFIVFIQLNVQWLINNEYLFLNWIFFCVCIYLESIDEIYDDFSWKLKFTIILNICTIIYEIFYVCSVSKLLEPFYPPAMLYFTFSVLIFRSHIHWFTDIRFVSA